MTREEIRDNMLAQIRDEYDKSEGGFFYDVIKAVAIELEDAYREQGKILDQGFVETAAGEYLDKKALEQGIYRKPPEKATTIVNIEGFEGAIIEEGILVASDVVNFVVKESTIIDSTGTASVLVECEREGAIGNVPLGAIKYFPITISGLTKVSNPQTVTNGYMGEKDEELRKRYYDKVRAPATSGNKYHYRNWALEIPGVGDVKVFPLWNGPGTVKIVVISSQKTGVDTVLVDKVKSHIEENRPIGATVTIESAEELPININVSLSIDIDNYTLEQVLTNIEGSIKEYLKKIAFIEDYVSYAQIGSFILQSEGVLDYSNLIINGGNINISIASNQVSVLGVIVNGS